MNHIRKRILSLIAASALSCSLSTNVLQVLAEGSSPAVINYESSNLKEVIVKLKGNAVLATPEASDQGADYIDTPSAKSAEDKLLNAQDKAAKNIRKLYPELDIKRRFTLTANAFSCSLPECIIPEIEKDPLIECVSEVQNDLITKPQLATAKEIGGINDFCNNTGFTGEGEVIAVIDTEFDISHDMFAPMTDVNTSIDRETVTKISNKNGFSSKINPENAYINNKIPFAYDYSDNTPYSLSAPDQDHGTHISGIAAGNRITTKDGKEISGIAPDAQILMMKVYNNFGYASDESIAAAIEDAVKLKADVINMSFGRVYEYYNLLFYADSIDAATNAGITLCASAGNGANDRLSRGQNLTTENVDTGTVCEPSLFPNVISVASADNAVSTINTLKSGSLKLDYCECGSKYCNDTLNDREYQIEFITSVKNQITEEKVNGKIVVFSGSPDDYYELDQKCLESGAAGIIIADDSCSGMSETYLYTTAFPVAVITKDDYSKLCETGSDTVSFSSTITLDKNNKKISDFSSYGVGTSLELKPEIMGIGGNVLSAAPNNTTVRKSGTSMSTPYVAGCAALYDQQMKQHGIKLTGLEKTQRIKNVLMNSATPFTESGTILSPRRQGAGLVSLDKASEDKVIMTGESGKAAIELFDDVLNTFSFNLNITNISSEDVTFSSSSITLTTDGYKYDEENDLNYIKGQIELQSKDDLDAEISVPAGQTITKTVKVKLNPTQTEDLSHIFTNGFFVEGYISLSGADNCCDISIPLLGFLGNWCKVPTIDQNRFPISPKVNIGYNELRTDISFAKTATMLKDIISNDMSLLNLSSDNPDEFPLSAEFIFNNEQQHRFNDLNDHVTFFSPNGDTIADHMGCYFVPSREASFTGINLYDSNDEVLYETKKEPCNSFDTKLAFLSDDAYNLPDGIYKGEIESYIRYAHGEDNKQHFTVNVGIDNSAPSVDYDIIEEDGRRILNLTASDRNLDGVYIFGTKFNYDPQKSRTGFNALCLTQRTLSYEPFIQTDDRIMLHYPSESSISELSDFQTVLTGVVNPQKYNFCDIIPVSQDGIDNFTMSYDITSFVDYSITVVDRAFNETHIISEGSNNSIKTLDGIYRGINNKGDRYFEFHENGKVTITDTKNKDTEEYLYKIIDDKLTIMNLTKLPLYEATIKSDINPYEFMLVWDDEEIGIESMKISYKSLSNIEFSFYSDEEIIDLARSYYEMKHGRMPEFARVALEKEFGLLSVTVYDYIDGKEEIHDVYTVNSRENLFGVDKADNNVELTEATRIIRTGVWSAYTPSYDLNLPRYFNFKEIANGKGMGVYANQSDGTEHTFECEFTEQTITFSFDSYEGYGTPSRTAVMGPTNIAGEVALTWDNGFYEILKYHPNIYEISDIGFLTNDNLIELTHDHFKYDNKEPTNITVCYTGYRNLAEIRIFLDGNEGFENWSEVYTVDIITGKGHNSGNDTIDLRNDFKGKIPDSDYHITGVWRAVSEDASIYYEFFEDGRYTLLDASSKDRFNGIYWINNDIFSTAPPDGNVANKSTGEIKWYDEKTATITWKSFFGEYRLTKVVNAETLNDLSFYSDVELQDLAFNYFEDMHGIRPEYFRAKYDPEDGTVYFEVYNYLDSNPNTLDIYTINRADAIGVDSSGNEVNLKEGTRLSKIGVWTASRIKSIDSNPRFFQIEDYDGVSAKGKYAYQSDGIEHRFECMFNSKEAVFSFESDKGTEELSTTAIISSDSPDNIILMWENGEFESLTYKPYAYDISNIGFLTNDELTELSRTHFTKKTGKVPDHLSVVYTEQENTVDINIYLSEDSEECDEVYTVDFLTGLGHNSKKEFIDLHHDFNEEYLLGDVNEDNKIDAKDSSMILMYYSMLSTATDYKLTDSQRKAADINNDYMIDSKDASSILGYYSFISTGNTASLSEYLNSIKNG